ncbi:MAG: hypothetical protein SPLM_04780 [Spiroplasma phoeniceum]|uniref:hypothetical protein n=1 Tax=Spiroplasma phoeniceum TaxID=47835 RepID=UPI003275E45A
MKKVLNILSAITLVSAGTSSAVAYKDNDVITSKDKNYSENKVNDISLAQDLIDNSGNSVAIIAINNSNQDNIISAIKNYPIFTDFYEIYGNDIKQVIDSEIKFTAADFKIGKIFKADKRTVASNKDLQDKGIFFCWS